MRSIKAVFEKQVRDMIKNKAVLIQFVVFPLVALVFTLLIARPDEHIEDGMFVAMMAAAFAGMTLVLTSSAVIAEEKEEGSLRFLMMAGVKPHQYLLGIIAAFLVFAVLTALLFAAVGQMWGMDLLTFVVVMTLGSAASMVVGATIGLLSPNQQAAAGLGMPVAMLLGFGPMVAMFNDTAERIFNVFYTQQISVVVDDLSASALTPVLIILANLAVLTALFGWAYRSRGLSLA